MSTHNITIYQYGLFATDGKTTFGDNGVARIEDAAGFLGRDADETSDIYDALESAIDAGEDSMTWDFGAHTSTFTWEVDQ